jgi:uncharacterized protein YecE (DUF72 family)
MAARAYIGTSGWNYKHWREIFYPKGVPVSKWLPYFAERYGTVEVNSSFYRIPRAEAVAKWPAQTPEGFTFAAKLWRGITHYKKLIGCAPYLENFFEAVGEIPKARRAPMLIQLPPGQGLDLAKFKAFWRDYRNAGGRGWITAVEFRHSSWLTEDVYRWLAEHSVAVCIHDMRGRGETDVPNDAPFVYMRRHGSGEGRYSGDYTAQQIANDARRVRGWLREGRDVYVYYNNDIGGHALTNARQLREAVTG